ncbi:MAG: PD-(D/E)XK nuclease domain-containing protein [Gammaproteobacteria bacterium]|nr:PD-(D/E)XK nuclease domain-containing protein [Gammaproteobacteria bacterium]
MQLENRLVDADFVTNFELGKFSHETLLFQSGYRTIKEKEVKGDNVLYHLDYPNYEVQSSFNAGLAEHLTKRGQEVAATAEDLIQALGENNFSVFMEKIQDLLAEFPHTWYDTANLGDYESWYASLLYLCFRTTQVDLKAEEVTKHGRSDMVLLHENQVFILELKMVDNKTGFEKGLDSALAPIREKGYAQKYRIRKEPIHLIGMVFGKKRAGPTGYSCGGALMIGRINMLIYIITR